MDTVKLNDLIKSQEELGQKIKTTLTNMKKDSSSRKTSTYIAEKQAMLTGVMKQIQENHEDLRKEERLSKHTYMTTNYFDETMRMYYEAIAYLGKCEGQLEEAGTSTFKITRDTVRRERNPKVGILEFRISQVEKKLIAAKESIRRNEHTWFLQSLLQTIQKQWETIEDLHMELIVAGVDLEDEYFTSNKFECIQEQFESTVKQLLTKMNETEGSHMPRNSSQSRAGVSLPKITIPFFAGDYESWYSFRDLFEKMIHNDKMLTSTEKMQYLKTHVRGEPAKMIQHLSISELNYEAAWSLLTKRYENERLIVAKFVDKILDLQKLEQANASKLKNMFHVINESIAALNNQGIETSSWDAILTRIVARKWDSETNNVYELSLNEPNKRQSFSSMMEFMEKRFKCLEAAHNVGQNVPRKFYDTEIKPANVIDRTPSYSCLYCNKNNHTIYQCMQFKTLTVNDRIKAIRSKRLCYNCLNHDSAIKCNSTILCHFCGKQHHSMIHLDNDYNKQNKPTMTNINKNRFSTNSTQQGGKPAYKPSSHVAATEAREGSLKTTVLATALVETTTYDGTPQLLRVLCDQGSEASFCTEEVAQILSYPKQKIHAEIKGICDENPKTSKYSISITLKPRFPSQYKLPISLIVLPKLTTALPKRDIPQITFDGLENKLIADPTYYKKGPIDIILGAQEYSRILLGGLKKIENRMIAQNTEFGWILSGWHPSEHTNSLNVLSVTTRTDEIKQLTTFWELEEVQGEVEPKEEDRICENYYSTTTRRSTDGTYTVRIPFKDPTVEYGESRQKAAARLYQLERAFAKNEPLRKQYKDFMLEYLKMGHMKKVNTSTYHKGEYYIPHQAVIREDSLTTKLRVVYDASSKSNGKMSLNDNMYKGPRLQQDLSTILLRWRKHKIAFTADIEKMYRFIKIHDTDRKYQRILWRFSPDNPIDEYELTTVTYGTTSAPYLAVKTLQKLAVDESENYPLASKTTLQDFFVDDLLSGERDEKSAKELQTQLIGMLKSGGFNLRKWSSNNKAILDNIPQTMTQDDMIKLPQDEARKSLGVMWSPLQDNFQFQIKITEHENPTKRFILSEISKIFDPMGWLAPIIIKMKLLIQELWINGTEWDTPVDEKTKKRWFEFQRQLKSIENIKIPRWTNCSGVKIELHGFSDASELVYAAVVYSRIEVNGQYYVSLLQAKTKVAPKKNKTTLPRLELCGALLLAKLINKVKIALDCENTKNYCWTDSMITIGWIKGEAGRWQTFVANRVSEIQRLVPSEYWNHVKTMDNPADVPTRGIEPSRLEHHDLWWKGPSWLRSKIIPFTKTIPEICQEIKSSHNITIGDKIKEEKIWDRFSDFRNMTRVMSYCLRMTQKHIPSQLLTYKEIDNTTKKIIRMAQIDTFADEYMALQNRQHIKKSSKLSSFDPFIDEDGVMRVGGRLQHSLLPYNQKHPIILAYNHHVTKLIVKDAHQETLHGGNKLTLAYIRQKYWIIGAKRMVKTFINKCVKCIRYRANTASQKMGQLPAARVNPSNPFSHSGVDYAGPIQVRTTKGRGNKSTKGYIALFICLATKAIHLELVGDLSTESFIAAFRRFMARRGHVSQMYSDNAQNFVGAAKFLHTELLEITQSKQFQSAITNMGTQWHFIPPLAPHHGGIWERGVRSMKHHLKRVIGDSTLTYEELSTLLCQIEACLNSRPLCAQSNDINDDVILTPSHFLIGRESVGIPDPISNINTDLLNRWKLIQKMKKDFWNSWTRDYLHQLQQRHKWKFSQDNLKIGTVVLIKDENITPSKWPLAKIKETHIGNDGINRVLTLQKSSGKCLKRAITTVIPLPINEHDTIITNRCAPATQKTADVTDNISSNVIRAARANKINKKRVAYSSSKSIKWMLWLNIIISIITTTMANYTIKNIEEGMYVEHIGTATIDRGVFRIQANYDKETIETDVFNVKIMSTRFQQFCENSKKTNEEIQCTQLYHHLHEEQAKLEKTKDVIMEIGQVRKKRGLFGQVLTSIFGVNDEVYKDIDTLQSNQNKLIEAANHQTKFMISTIATVNQTEERITGKLARFQEKLNQAISYLNNANVWYKKVDNNQVNIHVLQMYQLAVNYITEIMEHYSGLLQVCLHQGTIYNVLKIKDVRRIITTANNKLPTKLKIVQNQMINTKTTENSTHIQVYAYFAIQDITKYTLIHVTPIPKKDDKDGKLYSIEIYHTILGIDYNNENYFELDKEEFKSCLQKNTNYICYPTSVKNMQSNSNCINDQLFKKTGKIECNTRLLNVTSTIWKQLYMPNTWIFITNRPVRTSIICDGEREEVTIQNTGVIHISENCIIKTNNNILAARRTSTIPILATYSMKANFSLNTNITVRQTQNMARDEEVLDSSRDLFQHLTNSEIALQTQLDNTIWKQIQSHSLVTSIVSSVVMFTLGILIMCYGPQMVARLRSKATPATAAYRLSARGPVHVRAGPDPASPAPPKPERRRPNEDYAKQRGQSVETIELRPIHPL